MTLRFIPDYSTITAPIRKLTQKEQAFEWKPKQHSAFDRLKDILSNAPVVTYFNESKTEIIVGKSNGLWEQSPHCG